MPFLATMPITMISPMKMATLKFVPVMSKANTTPAMREHGLGKNSDGSSEVAELRQQHAEDQRQRQHQNPQQIVEGLCCS